MNKIFLFLFSLSSCLFFPDCSGSGSTFSPSIVGRTYYQLSTGYSCSQFGTPVTLNYKAYIQISDQTYAKQLVACGDTPLVIYASSTSVSSDLNTITYSGATYTYSATAP